MKSDSNCGLLFLLGLKDLFDNRTLDWDWRSFIGRFGSQNGCSVVPNTWLNKEVTWSIKTLSLSSLITLFTGVYHPWPVLHNPWRKPKRLRRQYACQHHCHSFRECRERVGIVVWEKSVLHFSGVPSQTWQWMWASITLVGKHLELFFLVFSHNIPLSQSLLHLVICAQASETQPSRGASSSQSKPNAGF